MSTLKYRDKDGAFKKVPTLVGAKGEAGDAGANGADGITPHIGDNGNWYLGDTDTGITAQGTQGEPGKEGKDGVNGKDGESRPVIASMTEPTSNALATDHTLQEGDLWIQPYTGMLAQYTNGVWGNIASLKGTDGTTPVKGTDYFTEADKQEIINAVLAALPSAEGGSF